MLRRERLLVAAAAVLALLSLGACQGYNFNPVGHCLIQPGSKRVTLSTVSTADVLFVVDDSNSMLGKQTALASNFQTFMTSLQNANKDRVAAGLEPIDFHIAVTSTSNFINWTPNYGSTCKSGCAGAAGQVCCLANGTPQPPQCKANSDCAAGYVCTNACQSKGTAYVWPELDGDSGCYNNTTDCVAQPIPCPTAGAQCGVAEKFYNFTSVCTPQYAQGLFGTTSEYPMGRFMAKSPNPLVLHFTKGLYCTRDAGDTRCVSPTPPSGAAATLTNLQNQFSGNAQVGTCGSGQEQGLEAARLAVKRALGMEGLGQTTGYLGDFLHPNAKLVVAIISDENDCSSPRNPATGVLFPPTQTTPSADGCFQDSSLPEAQQRQFHLTDYADFFTSLGRPFGAAFVVSANSGCQDASCVAQTCTQTWTCSTPPSTCGGVWGGYRYLGLADQLRAKGADVVVGSVCDDFGTNLGRIAEIVKPPIGLILPTLPAAGEVTVLRIADGSGATVKTCRGPAPAAPANFPGGLAACPAQAAGAWTETNASCYLGTLGAYDWWFTATKDEVTAMQRLPTAASRYVYINHSTMACEANPGQTYSAEYIGQTPVAGPGQPGGCATVDDCTNALGGTANDWTCFRGYDGSTPPKCLATSTAARGSCVCGRDADVCPGGHL